MIYIKLTDGGFFAYSDGHYREVVSFNKAPMVDSPNDAWFEAWSCVEVKKDL